MKDEGKNLNKEKYNDKIKEKPEINININIYEKKIFFPKLMKFLNY